MVKSLYLLKRALFLCPIAEGGLTAKIRVFAKIIR